MQKKSVYERGVYYYETDKMGIVHHANYVHYMEEARLFFLAANGYDYSALESSGVFSPVVGLSCRYHSPLRYGDSFRVIVSLSSFTGLRFVFRYRMEKKDGLLVFEGTSEHCFVDDKGKPIFLKRSFPDLYEAFSALESLEES